MAYGSRNERTLERNQDNFQWQYAYDELLRLKAQTDPNALTRTVIYDTGGRIQNVNFNSGRQDSYDYDDNNNLKAVTRRVAGVSTTTGFKYDSLDHVRQVTDPYYQTVNYGYDALSRVTALVYPDGKTLQQSYDPLNRLTNQLDWAGRQMNYAYDPAGRLVRRAYPNGIIQTNAFDNAGRITALSYAPSTINSNSINLALTYAYDRNGNKTGGGEQGTFAWPLPSLIDETSRFMAAGRITNRVDALNATNNFTYQHDASGNMTNASGGGQSWTLTYDEDNRTTSIFWQVVPMTDKLITNRYDALGRRVSRTLDGVEARYVLDLQGSMKRILCETDAGGNITAWYVHGPDLCYKVNATNGLTCYHADAQANIIALTDGTTNLVTQYAYTPYGRSLGSTNFQSQIANPYLFVGSQGAMEELPGLYFMRARYYSADAGDFPSTDPVKKIGPGWKPESYLYASSSPIQYDDPQGLNADRNNDGYNALAYGAAWIGERVMFGTLDFLASYTDEMTGIGSGTLTMDQFNERNNRLLFDVPFEAFHFLSFSHTIKGQVLGFIGSRTSGVAGDSYQKKSLDTDSLKLGSVFSSFVNHTVSTVGNVTVGIAGTVRDITGIPNSYSLPSRTAAVAAPKASAVTGTNPSGASSGGITSSGGSSYTIRAGDTLGNIAYANHTTVATLASLNHIANVNNIPAGGTIRLR